MANVIVEGFGTYGVGDADTGDAVRTAMLAGAWTAAPHDSAASKIGKLPWDDSNEDLYLSTGFGPITDDGWRRVIPTAKNVIIVSFYYAVNQLPNSSAHILDFNDSDNEDIARLDITSTGALKLTDGDGTALATTSGPVIVAETPVHVECKIDTTNGTFDLYINETQVIDASSLTFSSNAKVAQLTFLASTNNSDNQGRGYISHLIVRDTTGSANNDITGDRKVATLFPNQDVSGEQGWTARPLQRFGVGILDLTGTKWVAGEVTTETDIGANEFTIEGQFRFKTLPTGSDKAVLFGKWDEPNNKRSYQLYLGGPDLENGVLTFRTSTDGQNGTVENKFQWKWKPLTGRWYHIAMVRSNGELLLFIDGIQQGLPVADTDTYFAGTAVTALGAQTNGSNGVAGNYFDGWQDEFRLTIGAARYTANFSPPTEAFPRSGDDPDWGSVKWLSSWDNDAVADDGPLGLSLSAKNSADTLTPNDGAHAYATIDERTPSDDDFIEAELVAATGTFTLTAVPSANETVTVGTKDGATAAVYKFVESLSAAYDVLIGSTITETMNNLAAAINGGDGEGSVYGTDTEANADVTGEVQVSGQLIVTANVPGSDGNSIATSDTCVNGSWGDTVLSGGADIPDPSEFKFERMPPNTTVVDSVTLVARQWRSEAGSAKTKVSFVGGDGGESAGTENSISNSPSLTFDTFEADPDTAGSLSPTSILLGAFKIDRTA